MPLDEYRKKRDFSKTPEPDGSTPPKARKKGGALFFSVQKHLASHLHYDLRLEWNGVLLSWAIPKGPSIDPADKRLAMQTEDHPYAYGTFEGVIPEGYGAGIVMLWDRGTWTPEVPDVDAALRKGDLKFTLDGYKLKGSWALIRTRGFGSGSKPSWLLIKHKDEWAGPVGDRGVRAVVGEDARRGLRGHPRRRQSRRVDLERPGEDRRHRQAVPAHHPPGGGDEGTGKKRKAEGRRDEGKASRKRQKAAGKRPKAKAKAKKA